MKLTIAQWAQVLQACGVAAKEVDVWSPVFAAGIADSTFSAGAAELPVFLGQVLHESQMLRKVREDLFYRTPGRLMKVWPSRFDTLESERPCLGNPEALANKVYGGRMGNNSSGDGFKFLGRGLMMVTGRFNYDRTGVLIGEDLLTRPERLEIPEVALQASIAWWEANVKDSTLQDTGKVTQTVNGGQHGLEDRKRLTGLAKAALAECFAGDSNAV